MVRENVTILVRFVFKSTPVNFDANRRVKPWSSQVEYNRQIDKFREAHTDESGGLRLSLPF
jgi:hypothetical protein